jgi:Flp pilus assembly protein TadD/mono/diheme cytochrome c family protein
LHSHRGPNLPATAQPTKLGWDVRLIAALSFVFALTILLTPHPKVQASEAPVTYSRQIAPILNKNCSGCHHTGGSGPFPLTTYAEAKRWASTIETVTQSRYMPPWLPEPGHGDFADARRMTPDEIALLKRWAETGAPEGNPAEAPPPPAYKSDWQLGPPDLVLEVDSPMQVPASGTDLFRNFILPFPLKESKWVCAMEIKPGSPRVVHHANLILDRAETLRRTHPHDWQQGIPGMDVVVDAGEGFDPDGHFLDWKPDSSALVEPAGMAWRLDPGNDLVLNMHLKPTGKVETIRARIGLYFTPNAPTKLPILVQLEHDAALNIPAGDANFLVEDKLTLPVAVDVLAIYPHAHYLGKRLEGWADLPDGSRKDLILIPNWDIDRQSIYRYAAPVTLPAGAVIHMRYSYDNSAANPHNPNSPPIRVTNGNRSVDEMGHLWLQLLPHPEPGQKQDPREPILRAWMQNVLEKSPADPTALFNLASLDMSEAQSQSDFATAATLYKQALKSRPNDARMRTALAAALLQSGDEPHARQELLAAIAADPTYPDAPYNLALIEAAANELPEALHHLQTTIALEPANLDARHGLVALYIAQNQLPEAIREQKIVTTLAPALAAEWDDLGALLARSGDRSAAAEAFHHALAIDPADTKAQADLDRLSIKPE